MSALPEGDKKLLSHLLETTSSSVRRQDDKYIVYGIGSPDLGILVDSLADALSFMKAYLHYWTNNYYTVRDITPASLLDAPAAYLGGLGEMQFTLSENTVAPGSSYAVQAVAFDSFSRTRLAAIADQLDHRAIVIANSTSYKDASFEAQVLCVAQRIAARSILSRD